MERESVLSTGLGVHKWAECVCGFACVWAVVLSLMRVGCVCCISGPSARLRIEADRLGWRVLPKQPRAKRCTCKSPAGVVRYVCVCEQIALTRALNLIAIYAQVGDG